MGRLRAKSSAFAFCANALLLPVVFLHFLILAAFSGAATAASPTNYGAHLYVLNESDPEKMHVAALISPGWYDDAQSRVSRNLAEQAHQWVIGQFRQRYPDIPSQMFDKMAQTGSPLDDRSFLVVIFENGDLTKIKATLRFSFMDARNPLLPFEQSIGWIYPRPKAAVGTYPIFAFKDYGEIQAIQGNMLEIKNLVLAQDAKEDLFPAMLHLMEMQTLDHIMLRYQIRNYEKTRNEASIDPKRLMPISNLEQVDIARTFPSRYLLECDQRMVPYYQGLGFKLVESASLDSHERVMEIDREGFVKFGRKFLRRPGGHLADWSKIRSANSVEDWEKIASQVAAIENSRCGCVCRLRKSLKPSW